MNDYATTCYTYTTITLPEHRKDVRAHRRRVRAKRKPLRTFLMFRRLGRKQLRACPKIVEPFTVRMAEGLWVPSLALR